MIKKLAVVTVGVSAGLMMAAPFASATEVHHDGGDEGSSSCSFTGGTAEGSSSGDANGDIAGISGASIGGVGGNNIGNIADCSDFLNNNLNGNQVLSNNSADLGLTDLPV